MTIWDLSHLPISRLHVQLREEYIINSTVVEMEMCMCIHWKATP